MSDLFNPDQYRGPRRPDPPHSTLFFIVSILVAAGLFVGLMVLAALFHL